MKFMKLKTLAVLGIIGVASALVATPSYAAVRVNQAYTKTANPGRIILSVIPGTARFGTLYAQFRQRLAGLCVPQYQWGCAAYSITPHCCNPFTAGFWAMSGCNR